MPATPAPEPGGPTAPLDGGRPTIAVRPFELLGAAPSQQAIAEAIPAELIASLSRLHWLNIIARAPSFQMPEPGSWSGPNGWSARGTRSMTCARSWPGASRSRWRAACPATRPRSCGTIPPRASMPGGTTISGSGTCSVTTARTTRSPPGTSNAPCRWIRTSPGPCGAVLHGVSDCVSAFRGRERGPYAPGPAPSGQRAAP